MLMPRYPDIQICLHSRNPLAMVSAVRSALRSADVDACEIRRFSEQALSEDEPARVHDICSQWTDIEVL